jgi:ATP-dependent RNA helicase DHX37/DHR1
LLQFQASGYDSSNAFVLPVGKRTLIKAKPATTTRILSKKQRKKLEKVVDKKKKKTERGELIEKLMSVQVTVHPFSLHIKKLK